RPVGRTAVAPIVGTAGEVEAAVGSAPERAAVEALRHAGLTGQVPPVARLHAFGQAVAAHVGQRAAPAHAHAIGLHQGRIRADRVPLGVAAEVIRRADRRRARCIVAAGRPVGRTAVARIVDAGGGVVGRAIAQAAERARVVALRQAGLPAQRRAVADFHALDDVVTARERHAARGVVVGAVAQARQRAAVVALRHARLPAQRGAVADLHALDGTVAAREHHAAGRVVA